MSQRPVKLGDRLERVVFKGRSLILQKVQEGRNGCGVLFIGNGCAITLDSNQRIISADAQSYELRPRIRNKEITVYTFYFSNYLHDVNAAAKELAMFIDSMKGHFRQVIIAGHDEAGLVAEEACNHTKRTIRECVSITTSHIKTKSKPRCDHHTNIVSELTTESIWRNLTDINRLLDDRRRRIYGDGKIPLASQNIAWTDHIVYFNCSHEKSLDRAIKYIVKHIVF